MTVDHAIIGFGVVILAAAGVMILPTPKPSPVEADVCVPGGQCTIRAEAKTITPAGEQRRVDTLADQVKQTGVEIEELKAAIKDFQQETKQ